MNNFGLSKQSTDLNIIISSADPDAIEVYTNLLSIQNQLNIIKSQLLLLKSKDAEVNS